MLSKALARLGLFVSLVGYGYMVQPRQVFLTGNRAAAMWSSIVLAAIAVTSVSILLREARDKR